MNWIEFDKDKIMPNELRPMGSYFQTIINRNNFIQNIDTITKGLSDAIEGVSSCFFPRDLDEYEIINHGFDGVNFSLFEDEITIDVPTFRKYLRIACEAYYEVHPESRTQLEEFLSRPQPSLEEGALPLWKEMRDAGKFPKPYSEF